MIDRSALVQRQVDAFNAGDLEGFLATYHSDARIEGVAPGEPLVGQAAIRRFYAPRLTRGLHCDVLEQAELGLWVIAHERVGDAETLAVFEIPDDTISRAVILRAPQPASP